MRWALMPSKSSLAEKILQTLRHVLPNSEVGYGLHEPSFDAEELSLTKECIESGWISYRSQFVDQFEQTLAEFLKVPHVISTVSGTAALHIALLALDVKPKEEILVPALTFAATTNAIAYCGAIPHLVDSSEENLGIDVAKLDNYLQKNAYLNASGQLVNKTSGNVIKGIIPVHIFGHAVDMQPLCELAQRYHLWILEDAAESLGSLYNNEHTGTLGTIGITSFNGNKIITTGGGGAVLIKDPTLAKRVRHLSTTAKVAHPWEFWHDEVGYNYRMPGVNAAIGCAQLKKLQKFLENKRKLALTYEELFKDFDEITYFKEPSYCKSNYWLNAILLKDDYQPKKNHILEHLNQHKIFSRGVWVPMHRLPAFGKTPRMDLSTAESLYDRVINLPSSPSLML